MQLWQAQSAVTRPLQKACLIYTSCAIMCIFQVSLQCMNPGLPRREYFRLYFGLDLIVMQALSSTICLTCSFSSFHGILQQIAQYIENTQAVPSRIGLFTDY